MDSSRKAKKTSTKRPNLKSSLPTGVGFYGDTENPTRKSSPPSANHIPSASNNTQKSQLPISREVCDSDTSPSNDTASFSHGSSISSLITPQQNLRTIANDKSVANVLPFVSSVSSTRQHLNQTNPEINFDESRILPGQFSGQYQSSISDPRQNTHLQSTSSSSSSSLSSKQTNSPPPSSTPSTTPEHTDDHHDQHSDPKPSSVTISPSHLISSSPHSLTSSPMIKQLLQHIISSGQIHSYLEHLHPANQLLEQQCSQLSTALKLAQTRLSDSEEQFEHQIKDLRNENNTLYQTNATLLQRSDMQLLEIKQLQQERHDLDHQYDQLDKKFEQTINKQKMLQTLLLQLAVQPGQPASVDDETTENEQKEMHPFEFSDMCSSEASIADLTNRIRSTTQKLHTQFDSQRKMTQNRQNTWETNIVQRIDECNNQISAISDFINQYQQKQHDKLQLQRELVQDQSSVLGALESLLLQQNESRPASSRQLVSTSEEENDIVSVSFSRLCSGIEETVRRLKPLIEDKEAYTLGKYLTQIDSSSDSSAVVNFDHNQQEESKSSSTLSTIQLNTERMSEVLESVQNLIINYQQEHDEIAQLTSEIVDSNDGLESSGHQSLVDSVQNCIKQFKAHDTKQEAQRLSTLEAIAHDLNSSLDFHLNWLDSQRNNVNEFIAALESRLANSKAQLESSTEQFSKSQHQLAGVISGLKSLMDTREFSKSHENLLNVIRAIGQKITSSNGEVNFLASAVLSAFSESNTKQSSFLLEHNETPSMNIPDALMETDRKIKQMVEYSHLNQFVDLSKQSFTSARESPPLGSLQSDIPGLESQNSPLSQKQLLASLLLVCQLLCADQSASARVIQPYNPKLDKISDPLTILPLSPLPSMSLSYSSPVYDLIFSPMYPSALAQSLGSSLETADVQSYPINNSQSCITNYPENALPVQFFEFSTFNRNTPSLTSLLQSVCQPVHPTMKHFDIATTTAVAVDDIHDISSGTLPTLTAAAAVAIPQMNVSFGGVLSPLHTDDPDFQTQNLPRDESNKNQNQPGFPEVFPSSYTYLPIHSMVNTITPPNSFSFNEPISFVTQAHPCLIDFYSNKSTQNVSIANYPSSCINLLSYSSKRPLSIFNLHHCEFPNLPSSEQPLIYSANACLSSTGSPRHIDHEHFSPEPLLRMSHPMAEISNPMHIPLVQRCTSMTLALQQNPHCSIPIYSPDEGAEFHVHSLRKSSPEARSWDSLLMDQPHVANCSESSPSFSCPNSDHENFCDTISSARGSSFSRSGRPSFHSPWLQGAQHVLISKTTTLEPHSATVLGASPLSSFNNYVDDDNVTVSYASSVASSQATGCGLNRDQIKHFWRDRNAYSALLKAKQDAFGLENNESSQFKPVSSNFITPQDHSIGFFGSNTPNFDQLGRTLPDHRSPPRAALSLSGDHQSSKLGHTMLSCHPYPVKSISPHQALKTEEDASRSSIDVAISCPSSSLVHRSPSLSPNNLSPLHEVSSSEQSNDSRDTLFRKSAIPPLFQPKPTHEYIDEFKTSSKHPCSEHQIVAVKQNVDLNPHKVLSPNVIRIRHRNRRGKSQIPSQNANRIADSFLVPPYDSNLIRTPSLSESLEAFMSDMLNMDAEDVSSEFPPSDKVLIEYLLAISLVLFGVCGLLVAPNN